MMPPLCFQLNRTFAYWLTGNSASNEKDLYFIPSISSDHLLFRMLYVQEKEPLR